MGCGTIRSPTALSTQKRYLWNTVCYFKSNFKYLPWTSSSCVIWYLLNFLPFNNTLLIYRVPGWVRLVSITNSFSLYHFGFKRIVTLSNNGVVNVYYAIPRKYGYKTIMLKIAQEDIVPVSSFPGIPSGVVVKYWSKKLCVSFCVSHSSPLKYENKWAKAISVSFACS